MQKALKISSVPGALLKILMYCVLEKIISLSKKELRTESTESASEFCVDTSKANLIGNVSNMIISNEEGTVDLMHALIGRED